MTETPLPRLNQPLPRSFYARPAPQVARDLLGKSLVRVTEQGDLLGGKIVETEAYLATDDPASHSFRGPTRRNQSMFGPPGTLYVYTIHAKYCMNISTEAVGVGSAVLIRAVEPLWGIGPMSVARGQSDPRKLTSGPAMLCQALGVTTADDGLDLVTLPWLRVLQGVAVEPSDVQSGPRIGIRQGQELPLRFRVIATRFASRPW